MAFNGNRRRCSRRIGCKRKSELRSKSAYTLCGHPRHQSERVADDMSATQAAFLSARIDSTTCRISRFFETDPTRKILLRNAISGNGVRRASIDLSRCGEITARKTSKPNALKVFAPRMPVANHRIERRRAFRCPQSPRFPSPRMPCPEVAAHPARRRQTRLVQPETP